MTPSHTNNWDWLEDMEMNCFHNNQGKQYAIVCLEGVHDTKFWEPCLKAIFPSNMLLIFDLYMKYTPNTGKGSLKPLRNKLNRNLISCRDSDLDYFFSTSELSKFEYQTYAYSWENYACVAEFIQKYIQQKFACNETYPNLHPTSRKLAEFLSEYTKLTYEIFIYLIFFKEKEKHNQPFTRKKAEIAELLDFESTTGVIDCISLFTAKTEERLASDDFDLYLEKVKQKISNKKHVLENLFLSENIKYTTFFIKNNIKKYNFEEKNILYHFPAKNLCINNGWLSKILEMIKEYHKKHEIVRENFSPRLTGKDLSDRQNAIKNTISATQLIKDDILKFGLDLQNPYLQKIIADIQRDFPV